VQYAVTAEPEAMPLHPDALPVRAVIDADDKDAALTTVEASYRRQYPRVGKLRMSVIRVRQRP
jgi:hypothetical protein